MLTTPAVARDAIAADLIAVLAAVTAGDPRVLTIKERSALPSGPFELAHRSLQAGLRVWVERQTRLPLGYVEQLYTFADRNRGSDLRKRFCRKPRFFLAWPGFRPEALRPQTFARCISRRFA
jgi:hypothetical protein